LIMIGCLGPCVMQSRLLQEGWIKQHWPQMYIPVETAEVYKPDFDALVSRFMKTVELMSVDGNSLKILGGIGDEMKDKGQIEPHGKRATLCFTARIINGKVSERREYRLHFKRENKKWIPCGVVHDNEFVDHHNYLGYWEAMDDNKSSWEIVLFRKALANK
jgi:hypothetical protein